MAILFLSARLRAVLLLAGLMYAKPVFGADFMMPVTDKGYLDTQGFSVVRYRRPGRCQDAQTTHRAGRGLDESVGRP